MGVINPWKHTLDLGDVFHNDELSFEEKRDRIVQRIKALPPYEGDAELEELVDELADAQTVSHFDMVWDAFYDWADWNRVWVATL